jgi:hypothetical protein
MAVLLNEDGLVPPLEQMAGPAMRPVEELRIHAVQLTHSERQVAVRSLHEKVIMIVHQAVGMADPVISFIHVLEGIQEPYAILIAFEDHLPLVASRGDMIYSASIFDS